MAQELINVGAVANDRTGDTWRDAMIKTNTNLTELFSFTQPLNTIVINEEADFPDQDATSITLKALTRYCMGSLVTTAKRFIIEPSAVLEGPGQTIPSIAYTGTGSMFTSTGSWIMRDLQYTCTNGTIFEATGSQFVILKDSTCTSCLNVGTFTVAGLFATSSSFVGVTGQGAQLFGASFGVLFQACSIISSSPTFIGIDLGVITTDLFRMENSTLSGVSGSIGIKGLAGSANITSGNRAIVSATNLSAGAITPFSGIVPEDIRWFIAGVTGSQNSRNVGDALLTTLRIVPIVTATVFEEVDGGNWTSRVQSRFTTDAAGVVTYNGEVGIEVMASGLATVDKVGGGADQIELRLAKNWVPGDVGIDGSGGVTQNTNPTAVPLGVTFTLTNGDNIRMIVANQSGTSDIDVTKANIIVREV